jgi:hypothetical protein
VIRGSVPKLRHVQPQNPSGRVVPLPRPVPTISVPPASSSKRSELHRGSLFVSKCSGIEACLRPGQRDNAGHPHIPTRKQKAGAASDRGGDFVRPITMTRFRSNTSFRCRLARFQLLAGVCSSLFLHSPKVAFCGRFMLVHQLRRLSLLSN